MGLKGTTNETCIYIETWRADDSLVCRKIDNYPWNKIRLKP